MFFEPCVRFLRIADVENRLDGAALGACADERFVGAFAEDELERADDDAFARAGFAGHSDEAGTEQPLKFLDQCEVANTKRNEHGRSE